MTQPDTEIALQRLVMALVGALAGLATWYFGELADTMFHRPRLYLFTVSFVMGGFTILLGIIGPLGWVRALAGALGLAALVSGLLTWATLRFDMLEPFFDSGLPLLAMALLLFIGTPFVSAGLQRRGGVVDYPLLFDTAWTILVRYLAAWLFTGVAWALVFLSNALFEIVGVSVIEDLLDIDPVPFALTGLFLGLAIAIMHELRAFVSPFLVLRLFRVILPVLTVVVGVFLVALPIRGLDRLFGNLSVAATLMAVTIAAITLITSTLDRNSEEEAQAAALRWSARIMCLMLPFLTAAAAWAVWLRVEAYGWTPERIAAALSAALLLGYAGLYALSVVTPGWAARIRQVNLAMALVVLALSALWLTPVVHAEAISTRSQLARFEAGRVTVNDLALWEMKDDWGRAGEAGLARLRDLAASQEQAQGSDLVAALDRLDAASSRFEFDRDKGTPPASAAEMAGLLAQIRVYPEGQSVSTEELATLQPFALDGLRSNCPRADEDGPGCVMILADLDPHKPGEEGLLLQRTASAVGLSVNTLTRVDGHLAVGRDLYDDVAGARLADRQDALLQAMKTGEFNLEPSGIRMITFGGTSVIP